MRAMFHIDSRQFLTTLDEGPRTRATSP